jgi:glycerol uptake facilitator-like aquaporin
MLLNKYLVEFLGSIFFIYVVLSTGNPLAIGAALALAMLLTKNISGGFINPVITITMEITVYVLFSVLVFIIYILKHSKEDITDKTIVQGFVLFILFWALAISTLKLDWKIPNGSPASYTPVSETVNLTATDNAWMAGLFIIYIGLGMLEIAYVIMDSLEYKAAKEQQKMEE